MRVPPDATIDNLHSSLYSAIRLLKSKADATHLRGNERLNDVTIHVKIAAAADGEQEEQQEEEAAAAAAAPKAKRARGEQEQQKQTDGIVATVRAPTMLLAQRSGYFKGLLLGGGADMEEGRSKILTIEVDAEQAGSGSDWIDWVVRSNFMD